MEKKTIGGFIATLRKANGMTQKELAERLNVSDKTISRWERDDGAPDLSAIPVIAEIFGVTCDELLRGERKSVMERTENVIENETTAKGERERQRILTVSLSKYKSKTFITMGISLVGLIAAMIGNFGFLRANIGFLCGSVFYLAGVICQAVFVNNSFLGVTDDTLEDVEVGRYKRRVIKLAEYAIGLSVFLLGFSSPLLLLVEDAYWGLSAWSWIASGMIFGGVLLIVFCVTCYFVNASLLKKGVYAMNEKEADVYQHNSSLLGKCAKGVLLAVAITFAVHAVVSEVTAGYKLAEKTTFENIEDFVAFMEQDISYHRDGEVIEVELPTIMMGADGEISSTDVVDEAIYYDELGNEISEEEALTEAMYDSQGNLICTFVHRNRSVAIIKEELQDGNLEAITVITYEGLRVGELMKNLINIAFIVLYFIELIIGTAIYFKKRIR